MKKTPPTLKESEIKKRLAKLIDVKTITTLSWSMVALYLAIKGKISAEVFMSSYGLILGNYFRVQHEKNENNPNGRNE